MFDEVHASGETIDARMVPGDWKRDRRIEEHAEVVGVVGALDEVAEIGDQPAAECLLNAQFPLIAYSRRNDGAVAKLAIRLTPADSRRFALYGVSMVRPYEARRTVPLPGTAYDAPRRGWTSVLLLNPS
jgi:hypothetical protein